jgi:hypothetical protein
MGKGRGHLGFQDRNAALFVPDEPGTVYWLAWSADSSRVAIARDNGKIAIWDLDTVGQILARLGLNP